MSGRYAIIHTPDNWFYCGGTSKVTEFWSGNPDEALTFPTITAAWVIAQQDCHAQLMDLQVVELVEA